MSPKHDSDPFDRERKAHADADAERGKAQSAVSIQLDVGGQVHHQSRCPCLIGRANMATRPRESAFVQQARPAQSGMEPWLSGPALPSAVRSPAPIAHLSAFYNIRVININNMMQHGLVERTRDKVDRRKLSVTLTQRGKALEAELMQYAIDINRIAVAGIDPAEVATCVDVLSRMSANLAAEFDSIPNTPAED